VEKTGIGGRIYAMRYVCHIARALTSAQVTDIEVGLARGSMGNSAQVGIHQYPTIEAENIEVVPDA
jgi:identified by metaGeneAnnotator